jgi:hypothetical protein
VLYLDSIPFYAGMTNDPVKRYKHHYQWSDCLTYNMIRHLACTKGKMMEMKVVYCSEDKNEVLLLEGKAIQALWRNGFNPLNRTHGWAALNFKEYPNIERLPHKILNRQILQHVVDNQINILKEYGYEPNGYINMDNPTGFSGPIRHEYPKSS